MVMEMCVVVVVVVVHIHIVWMALLQLCIPLPIVCSSSVISILGLGWKGAGKTFSNIFPAFPGKICKQFSRHFFKQYWDGSRWFFQYNFHS